MAIRIFLLFVSLLEHGSCLVTEYELLAEDERIVPLGSLGFFFSRSLRYSEELEKREDWTLP